MTQVFSAEFNRDMLEISLLNGKIVLNLDLDKTMGIVAKCEPELKQIASVVLADAVNGLDVESPAYTALLILKVQKQKPPTTGVSPL